MALLNKGVERRIIFEGRKVSLSAFRVPPNNVTPTFLRIQLENMRWHMMEESTAYFFWPNREYLLELLRPWKLTAFSVGMTWLIYGALNYNISDWDVGISFIMGGLTYLCAPWSVYVLLNALRFRPRGWPIHVIGALIVALFVVDWVYWIYHTAMGNQMFRLENFYASSALYFLAGAILLYRGSIRDFFANLRALKHSRRE